MMSSIPRVVVCKLLYSCNIAEGVGDVAKGKATQKSGKPSSPRSRGELQAKSRNKETYSKSARTSCDVAGVGDVKGTSQA